VSVLEAAVIRERHADLLRAEAPSPRGACAFLDASGGCRIYEDRPYVCRTQGLPLRWYAEDEHDDILEERAICERNLAGNITLPVFREAPGVELEALPESDTWLVGPWEERLVELECQRSGGEPERILLRSLFVSAEQPTASNHA
jgi:hypothetical protein